MDQLPSPHEISLEELAADLWYLSPDFVPNGFREYLDNKESLPSYVKEYLKSLDIEEIPSILYKIMRINKISPDVPLPLPANNALYDISQEPDDSNKSVLAFYYKTRLENYSKILPCYCQTTSAARKFLQNWFATDELANYEIYSQMKENGDIDVVLGYTPNRPHKRFSYNLMEFVFESILFSFEKFGFDVFIENEDVYKSILQKQDNPDLQLRMYLIEEEEDETYRIEILMERKRLTFRCLESFHLEGETPFVKNREAPTDFQKLTHYLLYYAQRNRLLPQEGKNLPCDIYPFLVERFLEHSSRDLEFQSQSTNDKFIQLCDYYSNSESLSKVLHEAYKPVKDLNHLACLNTDESHCKEPDLTCPLYFGYQGILGLAKKIHAKLTSQLLNSEDSVTNLTLPSHLSNERY